MPTYNDDYTKTISFGTVTDADAVDGLESEFELIEAGFDRIEARLNRGIVVRPQSASVTRTSLTGPGGFVGFNPSDGSQMDGPFSSDSPHPWQNLKGLAKVAYARDQDRSYTGGTEAWFRGFDNDMDDYGSQWTVGNITSAPVSNVGVVLATEPTTFPVAVLVMYRANIIVTAWNSEENTAHEFAIGQWSDNSTLFGQPAIKGPGTSAGPNDALAATTKRMVSFAGVVLIDDDAGAVYPIGIKTTLGGSPDYTIEEAEVILAYLGAADTLEDA